jgi:GNAT superfamily N-acetyltransferase
VSNSSILPDEDVGFGGSMDSPFHDTSALLSVWRDPNVVQGEEVLVAEMDGRIAGCVTVEDRGRELELVNIDVPLELQGRGIGMMLVRSVEERARAEGKHAVTAGTSRNAEGVPALADHKEHAWPCASRHDYAEASTHYFRQGRASFLLSSGRTSASCQVPEAI